MTVKFIATVEIQLEPSEELPEDTDQILKANLENGIEDCLLEDLDGCLEALTWNVEVVKVSK